jgi:hypothetical protein
MRNHNGSRLLFLKKSGYNKKYIVHISARNHFWLIIRR